MHFKKLFKKTPCLFVFDSRRSLEIKRILDQIFRWIRTCSICGSLVPPIDSSCDRCLDRILSTHRNQREMKVAGYPFPVFSVIEWSNDNDRLVQPFLNSLKGGWAYGSIQKMSEMHLAHALANLKKLDKTHENLGDEWRFAPVEKDGGKTETSWLSEDLIVVHPPSSSGAFDHAAVLAHLLARQFDAKVVRLKRISDEHRTKANRFGLKNALRAQKTKSLSERHELRFELPPEAADFSGLSRKWVFVDDVITTGATAMAAYMALGDPSDFVVLTIANRPKLAVNSRV